MSVFAGEQVQSGFGDWSGVPTSFAYQWQYSTNGVALAGDVSGEIRSDYITVDPDDLGLYFRCAVTATNAGGDSSVSYSDWVGPVGIYVPPVVVGAPAISVDPVASGSATVGATLSSTSGSWTNSPTSYAYLWQTSADGTTGWVDDGAGATLALTSLHADLYLRCQVTATNSHGSSSPAYTNVLGPVGVSALTPVSPTVLALTPI